MDLGISLIGFLIYALIVLIIAHYLRRRRQSTEFDYAMHRNLIYDNPELVNRNDSSALVMKDNCFLQYERKSIGHLTNESLVYSRHHNKKSRELVLVYLNETIVKVRINGVETGTNLEGDDYIAAWKLLELGRNAWAGKPLT